MTRINLFIGKFMRDEEGASAIEYALVVAMVALVLVAFIAGGDTPISTQIKTIFQNIQTALAGAAA